MDEAIVLGGLGILFTGMVVLVPVLGLTLRFAIKPFFDTWVEIQRTRLANEDLALQSRQINLLEAELQQVQHTVQGLADYQEFRRKLGESGDLEEQLRTPAR